MAFSGIENYAITTPEAGDWTAYFKTTFFNKIQLHFFSCSRISKPKDTLPKEFLYQQSD
jgi:hypothetical protein